jgi:parallel beta-helix repeat protein
MIIQNIEEQNLTSAIQLFGTNNTLITNCKSRITLTNSNNNTISNNEINVAKYVTPIWLINSNSNTITNNKLTVVTECAMFIEMSSNNRIAQNLIYGDGITLRDNSEYNKIENNTILANNGSSLKTGIGISSGSNYNYIYENNIANSDNGIYLYTSAYNVIFKNNVCYCKNSLTMSSSTYNDFLGNNFIDAAEQAIYLFRSDYNNFFYNSFEGNTKVTEGHVDTLYNMTFYAEYNRWDNGKEGNYWSDYTGKDNGSGVGETPYVVYDNFTDNYPLTIPYDINKIQVTFEQWNGSSIVS